MDMDMGMGMDMGMDMGKEGGADSASEHVVDERVGLAAEHRIDPLRDGGGSAVLDDELDDAIVLGE